MLNNFIACEIFTDLYFPVNAVGDFAVENNNSVAGSTGMMDNLDRFEDSSADGFSQFDPSLMVSPQQFAWNGMSPQGIIF